MSWGPVSEMERWVEEQSGRALAFMSPREQQGARIAWERELEQRTKANAEAMARAIGERTAVLLRPNPTGPLHFRRHFKLD